MTTGTETEAKTVFERVRGLIVEQLGVEVEDVVPGASLIDDLGADSLDLVEHHDDGGGV